MNVPNQLTVLRIIFTVCFVIFLLSAGLTAKIFAFFAFGLASLTDILDGYLAKRNNQVTDFGKLMDPIADKILVLSSFISFVGLDLIPAWTVVVIIIREIAVTALRGLALTKKKVISASGSGKQKTVSQIFVIFVILIYLILNEGGIKMFSFWTDRFNGMYKDVIFTLMCITVVFTLISGVSYFIKNKEVYSNEKTH